MSIRFKTNLDMFLNRNHLLTLRRTVSKNMTGQLCGIVYGAAVGDALGVPYGFMKRDSFECAGTHRR